MPLIGVDHHQGSEENPADLKAAREIGKLYDQLIIDNQDLKIDEYSRPILTQAGFVIIRINDIKKDKSNEQSIEKKVDTLIRIKTNQQLNQFSNIYLNKIKKDLVINEL